MEILEVYVDGYKNISTVNLKLDNTITALIGFNNTGKSNLLQSIIFGFSLIRADYDKRHDLLKNDNAMPVLEKFNLDKFSFEVKFKVDKEEYLYKLVADWNTYSIIEENILDKKNESRMDLFKQLKDTIIASVYEDNNLEFYSYSNRKIKDIEDDCYLMFRQLKRLKNTNNDCYDLLVDSFLNLFPDIEYIRLDYTDTIYYKEHFLDRELPLKYLSSGPQKILKLLIALARLDVDRFSIVFFEEVENSLHPILIENLLIALDVLSLNTKIIITSHSPYLIQHINLENIYLSVPSNNGRACFKTIKEKDKLLKLASEYDQSTGEFIFNLMLEAYHYPERLLEWL
jgi:predicted ATP-dependent endonuclease of OLD family